jgi:ABC-type nitrate/sulfonate/bicarbonate transport system substrate-binding protein
MAGNFEHASAQLAGVAEQQNSLTAAVAAGELWMEAGVAERAAARCEQAVRDIDDLVYDARDLTRKRRFGDNEDGQAAAERFAQTGQDYIDTMRNSQHVFRNMADTYRAAGRTVTEADATNEKMLRGGSV